MDYQAHHMCAGPGTTNPDVGMISCMASSAVAKSRAKLSSGQTLVDTWLLFAGHPLRWKTVMFAKHPQ
jgi:hypothetical protein